MAASIRPPITIPVGSFNPSIPNTSIIDGTAGITPRSTQIKNGAAMRTPTTLATFLVASTTGLRFFNYRFPQILFDNNAASTQYYASL